MRQDHGAIDRIPQFASHIGADDRIEQIVKRFALRDHQVLIAAKLVAVKIFGRCTHDAKSAMAVSEGDRNSPVYIRPRGDLLIGRPRNFCCRAAHSKDRIKQQVHAAGRCADNQFGARDSVTEAFAGACAGFVYAQKKCHRQGNCQQGEQNRSLAVHEALPGERQDSAHADTPARFISPRSTARSKCVASPASWLTKRSAAPVRRASSLSRSMN